MVIQIVAVFAQITAVVFSFIICSRARDRQKKVLIPFCIAYALMTTDRIWEAYALHLGDISGELPFVHLAVSLSILTGLSMIITGNRREDDYLGRVLTRYPFHRLFYDAAIGCAIISIGNRKGDRLWDFSECSETGRWLRVNPAMEKLIQMPEKRMRGYTVMDLVHPDDEHQVQMVIDSISRSCATREEFDIRFRSTDGKTIHAKMMISTVCDDAKKPIFLVSQVIDISKEYEARVKIERAMNAIAYERDVLQEMARGKSDIPIEKASDELEMARKSLSTIIKTMQAEMDSAAKE